MRLKSWLRHIDPGFFIVLAITWLAVWPFLSRPGLPQATDAELHIFRLHELSYLIRNGEIYPRWAPDFYHAYGYPIFNYYAPLSYYVGLVFELMPKLDAVDGVKAVFVLGLLTAAVGIYGYVRPHWGRLAGYVAAACFVYAPYMQYIDPHARGALAESFSFGMFALALWALDRLRQRVTAWRWVTAVFTTAGVILSHNLMALLLFAMLAAWAVWPWWDGWQDGKREEGREKREERRERREEGRGRREERGEKREGRWAVWGALALAVGVAAFFWLPVMLERNAVNLTTLLGAGDNYDFRTHFLSWGEMLTWTRRLDWGATEPAFRFNLGVAQWVLALLGVLFLVARRVRHAGHVLFFALAAALLLFMMLPVSQFVWEAFPFLPYFQFPWRLMGAAAAVLAVLAGAAAAVIEDWLLHRLPRWRGWGTAVLVALPIVLGLPLTQPFPWPDFGEVSTRRMTEIEHTGRWLGTTSTADYVPATVDMIPERNGNVVYGLYEGLPVDHINWAQVPEGTEIETEYVRPLLTRYTVHAPKAFKFRLFLFDFPGWQVRVDGERVETELGRPEGFIVVPLTAGEHEVEVKFGSTPARSLAVGVTFVALFLTLALAWRWRRSALTEGAPPSLQRPDWLVLGSVSLVTAVTIFILSPLGWLHYESTGLTAVAAQQAAFADFGRQIALIGYDTTAETAVSGDDVTVTLYWKAQVDLDINYQVFVHLLAPDGFLVTQSDKLNPGDFPTRRWPLDKYVRDVHVLHLPADLPAGNYTVAVGLWVQTEGWRLPLLDAAGAQIGDNQALFTLQVK
ncbi:MAG: hypothetical protein KC443_08120 [Anaerolineales bacterium]|nr:hypothetical protein [Anaerolineales bacterium]